jgi:hypothetical protein
MSDIANRPSNSPEARLPAIPKTGIPAVDKALDAIREHLEVREGGRGVPWEKTVTERRLRELGIVQEPRRQSIVTMGTATGTVMLRLPDGSYVSATLDTVAQALRQTKLYRDLQRRIDDVARFDDFDEKVRALLLPELDQIAAERGADIRRTEQKLQTATESFAAAVTEVTAAVEGAMAGVRQTLFATANDGRATAGSVTQVTARLDGFGGGVATVEEVMTAIADRTTGLAAEYYVKVSAGKAIASIGLAASEDPGGSTLSSIILQADALAIAPAYDYAQTGTPSATGAGETWYKTSTGVSYRSTAAGTGSWVVFTPVVPFTFDTTTGNASISGDLVVGGTVSGSSFKTVPQAFGSQARVEITAWDSGPDANSVIGYNASNVELLRLSGAIGKLYLNCSSTLESAIRVINNAGIPCVSATNSGDGPAIKGTASGSGYAIEGAGPGYVSGNFTVGGTIFGNLTGNVTGNASTATTAAACSGNAATATQAGYATTAGEVTNAGNAALNASSGSYKAIMQTDGNFVIYSGATPVYNFADVYARLAALEAA